MDAMTELPSEWEPPPDGRSDLSRRDFPVDPYKARGLDFTPEELVARKRNRRWMLGLAVSSIVVLVLALIASGVAQSNQPKGPHLTPPPGYKVVTDGYFGYVVPKSWTTSQEYSDNVGDIDTTGTSGWAGEHVAYRLDAPVSGEVPPVSLQAFGLPRPKSFQLTGGHPTTVIGAATAYAYTMTRPGGFVASVVDAWDARAGIEIWLVVKASPTVTDQVMSSLRA